MNSILFKEKYFWLAIIVTFLCSFFAKQLSLYPGLSLIGHLVLALLIGMIYQLVSKGTATFRQGTAFIANRFLRAGIILLGFKLNLSVLLNEGIKSLGFAAIMVTIMLILNYIVAQLFKVDYTLSLLVASGCSICGAAAVMGVSVPLKAKSDDSALAVAIVAILGTTFTLIEIGLQPILHFTDTQFGAMAGLSLHEIAHAVAAGGVAGKLGMDAALITKLSRVLILAPVALLFGFIEAKRAKAEERGSKLSVPLPYFMGGFILTSAIGSYMSLPVAWIDNLVILAYTLLGMAMAALGINVNFNVILKNGFKPFASAFLCSVVMMGIAYFIALNYY